MSTSRRENSFYKHKYRELVKAVDDIKAEIDQKQYDFMADKDYDEGIRFGLMLAYQIIDRHIGKEKA